nr:hypothetical protein [Tanacetum cinerariifolium]
LQIKQKQDGIFISQDKYVTKILKKYGFTKIKNASTPMKNQKPLLKDEDGKEVDVYMYRSMIGSLMYLTSSRPNIMFAVCAFARYQVNPKVSHLHVVQRIFSYYAGASLDRKSTTEEAEYAAASSCCGQAKTVTGEVQLQALVDGKKVIITESTVRRDLQLEDAKGVDCLTNAAIFEQLTLMGVGKGFSRRETPLFPTIMVQAQEEMGEGVKTPRSDEDSLKLKKLMELCTNLHNMVLDLENIKTTQELKIDSLKRRVKKLEKKQRSITHKLKKLYKVGLTTRVDFFDEASLGEDASKHGRINDIDANEGITLISSHDDAKMFDGDKDLHGEEEKGKAIIIEEPVKLKKKHQIMLDEEVALKLQAELQAEFDKEEQRLARESAQKEQEVNSLLIEE